MKDKLKKRLYIAVAGGLLIATAFAKGPCKNEQILNRENTPILSAADVLLRDSVVAYAEAFLGTPYVYGSCSKDGFDCSGFVYYVFKHFDIEVPRSSSQYKDFGEEVAIEQVKKGDVLVFLSPTRNAIGHLGIVVTANGKESKFIHATSGKAMSVVITSLTNKGYTKRFVKAVRVLK